MTRLAERRAVRLARSSAAPRSSGRGAQPLAAARSAQPLAAARSASKIRTPLEPFPTHVSEKRSKQKRRAAEQQEAEARAIASVASLAAQLGDVASLVSEPGPDAGPTEGDDARPMSERELEAYARWSQKERRKRIPDSMPAPKGQGDVEVLYAKYHEELKALNDGEKRSNC